MASSIFLAEQLDLKSLGPGPSLENLKNEVRSGIPCWKEDKPTYCDRPVLFQRSTELFNFAQKSGHDLKDVGNPSFFSTTVTDWDEEEDEDEDEGSSDVPNFRPSQLTSRPSKLASDASRLSLKVSEIREAADLESRIQKGFIPMRITTVHADRMLSTLKELLEKLNFFKILPQVISEISVDDGEVPCQIPKELEASLLQLLHVQATWQYIDDQTPHSTSKFLRNLMHFAQSKLDEGIPAPVAPLSLLPRSKHPPEEVRPKTASEKPNLPTSLPSDCYRVGVKLDTDSFTDLKQLNDWDAETDQLGNEMEHLVNQKLRSKMHEVLGLNTSQGQAGVKALEDLFGGDPDLIKSKAPKKKLRVCHFKPDGVKCCEPYSKARSLLRQNRQYKYTDAGEGEAHGAYSALDAILDNVYRLGLDRHILKGDLQDPYSEFDLALHKTSCTSKDIEVQKRLAVLEQMAQMKPAFFESLVKEALDWDGNPQKQNDRSLLMLSAVKGQHGKRMLQAFHDEDLAAVLQCVQVHVDLYKQKYQDANKECKPFSEGQENPEGSATWRQKWRQHFEGTTAQEDDTAKANWKLLRNNRTKQMILVKKYKDSKGRLQVRKVPLNDHGQPEIREEKRMRKAGSKVMASEDLEQLTRLREEFGDDMPVVAIKKYLVRARKRAAAADEGVGDDNIDIGGFDEFYESSDDASDIAEDDLDFDLLRVTDGSPENAPNSKNTRSLAGYLGVPPEIHQNSTKIDVLNPPIHPGRWNHIEKLIAKNHHPSQQDLERHLRAAYRETFREAYNNRERVFRCFKDLMTKERASRALKLFVEQVEVLLRLMEERMLVTPEEEVMKIHVLRQTWIREQRLLRLLYSLKNKFLDLRTERDLKIGKLNEAISSLMTQIDTVYTHTRQELSMIISEYTKMELLTNKSADHAQQGLQGVLQRCVAAGSAFRAKYAEIEEDLQKQKRKHEAELQAIIAQYDTEMFDRQARLDQLEQEYKEQQLQVDMLSEELKSVEKRTAEMEDEERKRALKRRKRKKRKKGKSRNRSKQRRKGKNRSRSRRSRKGKRKGNKKSRKSKKSETSDTEEEYTSNEEEGEDEEEETEAEEEETEEAFEANSKFTAKPTKKKIKKSNKTSKSAKKSKPVKSPKASKKSKKKAPRSAELGDTELTELNVEPEEVENDGEGEEDGGDASVKPARGRNKTSKKRKRSKKSKRGKLKVKSTPQVGEGAAAAENVASTNSLLADSQEKTSSAMASEASLTSISANNGAAKSISGDSKDASETSKTTKKNKFSKRRAGNKKRSKSRKRSKKKKKKSSRR